MELDEIERVELEEVAGDGAAAEAGPGSGLSTRLRNRRRRTADEGVAAELFSEELERLRDEASAEQRSAWAYLGAVGLIFLALVLFGYGCGPQRGSDTATGDPAELMLSAQPLRLVIRVDGDVVTASGDVPDDAVKGQLLTAVQQVYGAENVVDELALNEDVTLEEGTLRMVGSAIVGDGRPEALQASLSDAFGLANRGFEVGFVDQVLSPASAEVAVAGDQVTLTGVVPDEASLTNLVGLATEIWGEGSVDSTGLTVGPTTWAGGFVRLTGSAVSSDGRVEDFVGQVAGQVDGEVTVDTSGLTVEDVSALIAEIEGQVSELVTANPISFEPLSADIDPSSDETLATIAGLVAQVPTVSFQVVGHTDSIGDEQENLVLSQDRAQAVVDRLVELGIPVERMSSRGEGESQPLVEENTDADRAANRRIEFVFVGTSGG